MHVNPEASNPKILTEVPDDEISEGEGRPNWARKDYFDRYQWQGLFKDVGIFTEYEWNFLMCKCLASMGTNIRCHFCRKPANHQSRDSVSRWRVIDHRPICRRSSRF